MISIDYNKMFIVNGKPLVILKDAIAVNGITANAQYDLSNVPSELHERFVKLIEFVGKVKLPL